MNASMKSEAGMNNKIGGHYGTKEIKNYKGRIENI